MQPLEEEQVEHAVIFQTTSFLLRYDLVIKMLPLTGRLISSRVILCKLKPIAIVVVKLRFLSVYHLPYEDFIAF
jgi:hypothetical protein